MHMPPWYTAKIIAYVEFLGYLKTKSIVNDNLSNFLFFMSYLNDVLEKKNIDSDKGAQLQKEFAREESRRNHQ